MKTWINKMKTGIENAYIRSVKVKDVRILILIIILGIIFHMGYSKIEIDGDSMESTYKEGDKVLINKITHKLTMPELKEVIVFYDPSDDCVLIKRIIALPYDSVEIIEGLVLVNDQPLLDEYSTNPLIDHAIGEEYVNRKKIYLNNEEYYVIGDNRSETWYGIVTQENIIGTVSD
jgi:signal peptidase I